jgi:hypothetical protein
VPGREQLRETEPDAEPAEPVRQRLRRVVAGPMPAVVPMSHDLPPHGMSTTLMQPSCLSRNVSYIAGPSSRLTRWVMTKEGSI